MRVIIDASVAIKWVVPEEGTDAALRLRSRCEFCAPELIVAEIANILWKKCQRGELAREEAMLAAELLANSGIESISMAGLIAKATELAITLGHPAYDCVYLAMAIETGLPFITADARLIGKLQLKRFDAAKYHDLAAMTNL